MRRRSSERGEGNIGCIFWALVLIIGCLIAWKVVPVKVQTAELYDYMDELARFSAARDTEEQLRNKIVARATELGLPVSKEQVTVKKGNDRVRMTAEYMVVLDFPGYKYEWNIKHELDRPIFIV